MKPAKSTEHTVGRIGALAVALGLGAAIATSPGVALADENPSTPDGNVGGTTTDQPKTTTDSPDDTNTKSTLDNATEPNDQDGTSETAADGSSSRRTGLDDLRRVIVRWSGGAHTSRFGARNDGNTVEKPGPTKDAETPGTDELDQETPETEAGSDAGLPPPAADDQEPPRSNPRRSLVDLLPARLVDRPELPRPAKPVIATLNIVTPQQTASRATGPNLRITSVDQSGTQARPITTALNQPDLTASAVPTNPVGALLAIPATIAQVATRLVSAVFTPLLAPSTPRPVETPILWAVLGWVRRQLFNQRPEFTLVRVDDAETGDPARKILVDVDAEDPEGDRLTYSATNGSNGTVTLNDDGSSFTYTPNAGFTGTDTFTVTVADTGGLITALTGRPHAAQQTVTVSAGNQAATTVTVGKNPWDVEVGPNGKVYVTNRGSGTISVIDTGNNNSVNTITVGGTPTDIAFSTTTGRAWVTDSSTNRIIVIDTATDEVLPAEEIQTAATPSLIVFTSDGKRAVLYEIREDAQGNIIPELEAFDATTRLQTGFTVGDDLPLLGGMTAVPNPARPGFRDVIVTIPEQDAAAYLDSSDFDLNALGVPITGVGREPLTIAFGNTLDAPVYMVADLGGVVTKLDARTNRPVDPSYDVGTTARNIKIVGNYAYVASPDSNRLTIIDTSLTNKVVTIDDAGFNGPLGVGVVGDRVYVANAGGNTVTVLRFQPS